MKLIKNPEFHKHTKHVDVRYHFIDDLYEIGNLKVRHVSSENQLADALTKPLNRIRFLKLINMLGLLLNFCLVNGREKVGGVVLRIKFNSNFKLLPRHYFSSISGEEEEVNLWQQRVFHR